MSDSKIMQLVGNLKDEGQDFEFYPTTKEMVRVIYDHANRENLHFTERGLGTVLDIGCGTCNFRKWIRELDDESQDKYDRPRTISSYTSYYVMEKSRILLERLDPDVVVLGTDFRESTLIDKPVDTIFCNPPYSEYEEWASRIIREGMCESIYLVIPQRWRESEKIKAALVATGLDMGDEKAFRKFGVAEPWKIIGSADFLDAERASRAKVDILYINRRYRSDKNGFDCFFDEMFGMTDLQNDAHSKSKWEEEKKRSEELKSQLVGGKNKVEILCRGYAEKEKALLGHFKAIASMDEGILETLGIHRDAVKKALKAQAEGLKNLYWQAAFDCLEEITSRLTSSSRKALLERFAILKRVDFTPSNIYALIIWVIKNANKYSEKQVIDLFLGMSAKENVQNYVSNKRVFSDDAWRYCHYKGDEERRPTHYTLDYRIVATEYALTGDLPDSVCRLNLQEIYGNKINDICVVAETLGFRKTAVSFPSEFGKPGQVLAVIGGREQTLFEFRCYQNHNVHLKLHMEFAKALNVVVSRKLGWIHAMGDIKQEFAGDMARGAEQYFDAFQPLSIEAGTRLMLPPQEEEKIEAPEQPESKMEQMNLEIA